MVCIQRSNQASDSSNTYPFSISLSVIFLETQIKPNSFVVYTLSFSHSIEHGASCEVSYSSTKHAIIGLSRSLAAELAPSGIRVNCIAPGVIDTDMLDALGEETIALLGEEIPLGRLGKAKEIAEAVIYLESARYVTGQVLSVNGGFPII